MFTIKKYVFIITLCLLITLLSSRYPLSKEELSLDQQKSESKRKQVPPFTIKGSKIQIVPKKKSSEPQKVEKKQEQAPTENQPQISLDSNHYDLGEVWEGDEIVHTFTVKNTGTAELNIKDVRVG